MHRLGRGIIILGGLALALGACWAGLTVGPAWAAEVLTAVFPTAPTTLDPHRAVDFSSWTFIHPCYQRLTAFKGQTTEVVPALAATWRVSDDGLLYTFVLNQDQVFADGRPVDAQAVKFSFDRALELGTVGPLFFPELVRTAVLGPHTIRFFLSRPSLFFPQALASVPASIVGPGVLDQPPDYLDRRSLGSGEYLVEEFEPNRKITLALRPEAAYTLPISRFEVLFEPDPQKELDLLVRGEVFLAAGLQSSQKAELEANDILAAPDLPGLTAEVIFINRRRPWLDRLEARRALGLSLDYQALRDFLSPRAKLGSNGPVPWGLPGVRQGSGVILRDLALAREKLAAAPPLPKQAPRLLVDAAEKWRAAEAELLRQFLKEIKVNVKITLLSPTDFKEALQREDFDLALTSIRPRTADPEAILASWLDIPGQVRAPGAGPGDAPEALALFQASASDRDKKSLIRRLGQVQEKLNDRVPALFLFQYGPFYGISKRLQRLEVNPMTPEVLPLALLRLGPPPPPPLPDIPREGIGLGETR
ncbi:MAG: ABC transporter substrate-binding protein [Pseudomonadota bacterium]